MKDNESNVQEFIRSLSLADDILFSVAFNRNIPATEHLVRTILSRPDITIASVETQKKFTSLFGHSVILDALAYDSNGSVIDIEVQRVSSSPDREIVPRMEFYAAACLLSGLKKGESYSMAKDVYVIFIVDRDIFGKGKPVYMFSMADEEDGGRLGGRIHIAVANGEYRDNMETEHGRFYHDFYESEARKAVTPLLREMLETYKEEGLMRLESDRFLEKYKEMVAEKAMQEGIQQGIQRGAQRNQQETAERMLRDRLPVETIAGYTDLSVDEVNRLASQMRM